MHCHYQALIGDLAMPADPEFPISLDYISPHSAIINLTFSPLTSEMLGILSHFRQQNDLDRQERVLKRETVPAKGYQQQAERAVRDNTHLNNFLHVLLKGNL